MAGAKQWPRRGAKATLADIEDAVLEARAVGMEMPGKVQIDGACVQDRFQFRIAQDFGLAPDREWPVPNVAEDDRMAESRPLPGQQPAQPVLVVLLQMADMGGVERDEQRLADPECIAERIAITVDEVDLRPPRPHCSR